MTSTLLFAVDQRLTGESSSGRSFYHRYALQQDDDSLSQYATSDASVAGQWHTSSTALNLPSPSNVRTPSPLSSAGSSYASSDASRSPTPNIRSAPSPTKKPTVSRRAKGPDHIPRPRNAFMIFRSAYCPVVKENKIEHDHRMISQILGELWKNLPADQKAHWQERAREEKRKHEIDYPNYRFAPVPRAEKAKKRNVKRNGEGDKQRCRRVAQLLLEGKGGDVLQEEVKRFDVTAGEQARIAVLNGGASRGPTPAPTTPTPPNDSTLGVFENSYWAPSPSALVPSTSSQLPFRSPLQPPSELGMGGVTHDIPPSPGPSGYMAPSTEMMAPTLSPVPLPQVSGYVYPDLSSFDPAPAQEYLDVQPQTQDNLGLSLSLMYPDSLEVAPESYPQAGYSLLDYDYAYPSQYGPDLSSLAPETFATSCATEEIAPQYLSTNYALLASDVPIEPSYPSEWSAQALGYPTQDASPQFLYAGEAQGVPYQMEDMNSWAYAQPCALDIAGEPLPAAGWVEY